MVKNVRSDKKIVVIGGGTGSFTILSGMKEYFSNITALVNMVDDGGSTGVLRDELGVLPPGDIRQCLVALSDAPESVRALFNFRFPEGTFAGHSFGNLFLSAVERMNDSFDEAVAMAAGILQISGRVLPITTDDCTLYMKSDGKEIVGQSAISNATIPEKAHPELWIRPPAVINKQAKLAILQADVIVIAPGNLYGSLLPALLVDGVAETLRRSNAKVVYIANLVNKPNHTQGFTVVDYVSELERFIGSERIDTVLYNTDKPSQDIMKRYALDGEFPVGFEESELKQAHFRAVGAPFLQKGDIVVDSREVQKDSATKKDVRLKRSYIRHDGKTLAKKLYELLH